MTLNKYDTRLKSFEELQSTLVCGEKILDDILSHLKPQKNKPLSVQSWIMTGPRGSGKTHLLTLLYWKIKKDKALAEYWEPILFPEELFDVDSLHRLLIKITDQLANFALREEPEADWIKKWNTIKTVRITGSAKQREEQKNLLTGDMLDLLVERSKAKGKKAILLIENLQSVFRSQLSENELKRLRAFMQEHPAAFLIVGTALTVFDQIENYGKPFYHFFRCRNLEALGQNEIIELLHKIASHRGKPDMPEKIRRNRPYIYTYALLTGGNARLILFLYELLVDQEEINTDLILEKITELTPYFRDKTLDASAQKKLILDALSTGAPAQTATEIAETINEEQKSITEQLKRMTEERWVREIPLKGKSIRQKEVFFTLQDYFYRIWYKMRTGGIDQVDVACMAELAVLLFDRNEIEKRKLIMAPDRSGKIILYEKALELAANESFMRNVQLLKDEFKKTVNKEIRILYKKIYASKDKQDWVELRKIAKEMQGYDDSEADGHFFEGNANAMSRNFSESILCYEKAVEIKLDKHEAWYNMGNSYFYLGDYKKSISCFEKAVGIKPDKYEAWNNMGFSYANLEAHRKAISCYEKAVEIKPDKYEVWDNMGFSFANLEDYRKAISCYEKAVEIKPDSHEAWFNMGNSYNDLENYRKSISCYEKAVEIKPDKHEAWNNMGNRYYNLGDYRKSISCYEKAVEIKLDKYNAWLYMGNSYVQLKSYDKAYSSYSRFIATAVRPRPWDYIRIIELRKNVKNLFNEGEEVQKMLSAASQISERLETVCRLIILGKWSAVTDSIDMILKENTWPEEESRKLEFLFQAEMLDILKSVPDQANLKLTLKYWILVLQKRYPARKIKEKCLEFIYNYVKIVGKEKFSINIVEELIRQLSEEGIEASDVIIKILKAVQIPDTREAQKWMADPLFSEIVKMLSENISTEQTVSRT